MKKKLTKKRIILIVILVVIAVVGVSCAVTIKKAQTAIATLSDSTTQTDTVSVRTLTKSVGATGKIVSVDKKDVTTTLTGVEIKELDVEVGDTVSEGDTIAVFDTSSIEDSLSDAQKNLSNTNASNAISGDNAERNVSDAETSLETTKKSAELAIANAQSNLDTAQKNYDDAVDSLNSYYDVVNNASAYGMDENSLAIWKTTHSEKQYTNAVDTAKQALETAQNSYESTVLSQNNAISQAESALASAQNAETSTAIQGDTTSQNRSISNYKEQLAKGTLTAPMSGIVTAVNFSAGDTYTGGTIVTIQDTSSYEIETEIGEYDISDIEIGQTVLIKTDATGDDELTGKVIKISPVATTSAASSLSGSSSSSSSSATYTVRISIDNPSDRLRLDMTASLSIIIEQHENAMTVPYTAVGEDADGNHYVMVDDGTTTDDAAVSVDSETGTVTTTQPGKKVMVDVVMESNYYTEISSDELKEGDTVYLINSEETTSLMEMMMSGEGDF